MVDSTLIVSAPGSLLMCISESGLAYYSDTLDLRAEGITLWIDDIDLFEAPAFVVATHLGTINSVNYVITPNRVCWVIRRVSGDAWREDPISPLSVDL